MYASFHYSWFIRHTKTYVKIVISGGLSNLCLQRAAKWSKINNLHLNPG